MEKNNNKYRLTLYLGKELHDELTQISVLLGLPLGTTTRIILQTGLEIINVLDKEVNKNGNKQQS